MLFFNIQVPLGIVKYTFKLGNHCYSLLKEKDKWTKTFKISFNHKINHDC